MAYFDVFKSVTYTTRLVDNLVCDKDTFKNIRSSISLIDTSNYSHLCPHINKYVDLDDNIKFGFLS